jgi:hypothetical protein
MTESDTTYLRRIGGTMTGALTNFSSIKGLSLITGDSIHKITIIPPALITAAEIQTVDEGASFDQKLTLQPLGGKVLQQLILILYIN